MAMEMAIVGGGWWVVVGRVKSGGRWDGRDGIWDGMGWDGLLH